MLETLCDEIEQLDEDIDITQYNNKCHLILTTNGYLVKKTLQKSICENERILDVFQKLYEKNNWLFAVPIEIIDDFYPYALYDYYCGSDLESFLSKQEQHKITQVEKLIIAYGICKSLIILHSLQIYHPNLSLSNILIDENFFPVLSDMLYSQKQKRKETIQTNAHEFCKILETIDQKCSVTNIFSGIIQTIKGQRSFDFNGILDMINHLANQLNENDFQAFENYKSKISLNAENQYHGSLKNIDLGAQNGLSEAIKTKNTTFSILKKT